MAQETKDAKATLRNLEETLSVYFVKKAPFQLPEGVKEAIVRFGPWITIVILVMALPLLVVALGLTTFLGPFVAVADPRVGASIGWSWIFVLVMVVLEVLALPGLFARKKAGWNFLFYSSLVSIVDNVVTFNVVNLIVGTLIAWYFLFQIRSYYK